jgi:hypothetical protein
MKALGRVALAAAMAALLVPSGAQARFGKRSSGSSRAGTSAPAPGPRAPPSGPPAPRPPRTEPHQGRYYPYRPSVYYGGWYGPTYSYYGGGYLYERYAYYPYDGTVPPPPPGAPPAPPGAVPPPPEAMTAAPPPPTLIAGVDGLLPVSGGAAYGLSLSLEGRRWGVRGAAMGFSLPSEAAPGERDVLRTLDAHLTYAVLSGERGRVRVEAGLNSVFAEDVVLLGPDGGVSVEMALAGPLCAEGSAHFTPVPHRRFDVNAGLALELGSLKMRAGWRHLVLDDNGVLQDGSRNIDRFTGPYLGLALAL